MCWRKRGSLIDLFLLAGNHKIGLVVLTNADQEDPTSVTRPDGLPNTFGFELAAELFDRLNAPQ
jgi:hypothetical protein